MKKLIFKNLVSLTKEEHENVLHIRNNKYIREQMKSKHIIELNNHLEWVEKLKQNSFNLYYAVFVDEEIVGGINITEIDYEQKKSTWGLYFKQNINPLISSISTYCIIDKTFNDLDLLTLNLEVNKNNIAAYNFDLRFGFKVYDDKIEEDEEYYLMSMTKAFWNSNKSCGILKSLQKKILKMNIKFEE